MPPAAAGAVLAVNAAQTPKSRLQRITFRTPGTVAGENAITVEIEGPDGARADLLRPPAAATIAAELAKAVPGARLDSAMSGGTNAYGPFGEVIAETGDGRCLYGWQWFDRADPGALARVTGIARIRPVSLRVRLCSTDRDADLAGVMQDLRLSPVLGDVVDAPFAAGTPGDALAAAGAGFGLTVPAASAAAPDHEESATDRPSRRVAAAPRVAQPKVAEEQPKVAAPTEGPAIPLPADSAAGIGAPRSMTATSPGPGRASADTPGARIGDAAAPDQVAPVIPLPQG
ncbi:hypothetical protein A6302_02286 [Methylobrevis pamukkalensis]|uniref:Cellulose biosynthesis protein BcsN n=1 Tax=Methylobrevis pamukkalensis TaxID=1439726 RepID=A0A1E3H4H6_9HYPH|nr:hypothetical protein A6302_02286 [Methylobrevis pamukkalensis]